MIVNNITLHH